MSEDRQRLRHMIRGGILAMHVDGKTKQALLAEMDALAPSCPECNVEQVAEVLVCRECGPRG